jgi:hypothetical protein
MILKATAKNKGLETRLKFYNGFSANVLDLAETTFKDVRSEVLPDFQQQPKVRKFPADYPGGQLPFDTLRQQRWYWANIGKPYTRTGRMAKGLEQKIKRIKNAVSVEASYPNASTKYILGNILGEQVRPYQQRFHAATGWQPAAPKLERHAQTYNDTFLRRYQAFIAFNGE